MTTDELDRFNRHLGAKFCDVEFQKKTADATDIVKLPIVETYARKLLAALGVEAKPDRVQIVSIAFIQGHLAGQDYAEMMSMEASQR